MIDTISVKRLKAVHPDLQSLMLDVLHEADSQGITIRVTSGVRTKEEQLAAYRSGASMLSGIAKKDGGTGVSEHQMGMAVDLVELVDGKPIWSGLSMRRTSSIVFRCAKSKNIAIEWGGNWKKFVDMPHYQLNRKVYKKPHIEVSK